MVDKNGYLNEDITISDFGANFGLYSTFFWDFKYMVLSFEQIPENNYVPKKFYRNNKDLFMTTFTITIINDALYPIETFCDYNKDLKHSKKYLIL